VTKPTGNPRGRPPKTLIPVDEPVGPIPSGSKGFADAAWTLYAAAMARGDMATAVRALRTAGELVGVLGEANRRKTGDLAARVRRQIADLTRAAK
jgi:hypothetical protein